VFSAKKIVFAVNGSFLGMFIAFYCVEKILSVAVTDREIFISYLDLLCFDPVYVLKIYDVGFVDAEELIAG
jgi:hypothetical protein